MSGEDKKHDDKSPDDKKSGNDTSYKEKMKKLVEERPDHKNLRSEVPPKRRDGGPELG